ncbi:glutathione S-transferase family protein [Caulobacter mirabilis]|uniref:Glutathione S-transferase n=1 Tax=Caulobacter mirabilis TaxID=69666 RepID=A0A2D2AXF3_9CAUL|nr:glutathione S-transferase family protein [Caulobacter mirabilis]ATQ42663.1 glutathione S-transferase [Caulobacter mirabilis]
MPEPLVLHFHPFASFCQKVLIAFYENDTPFETRFVDLGDPEASAPFRALWPIAKMPVMEDRDRGVVLPESSVIIEYLDHYRPGPVRFVPADPDQALEVRRWDRFSDGYIQEPMTKVVTDRIRPPGANDPEGVARARALLDTAYDILEPLLGLRAWAAGDAFTLADCGLFASLGYADVVHPFGPSRPNLAAYLARARQRPSFARVLAEAEPYWVNFPRG